MKKITLMLFAMFAFSGFAQNIVNNGDFSGGIGSWSTFIADFAGVSAEVNTTNNEANVVNIAGAGGQVWHIQLNQILTPTQISLLTTGQNYKITFDARGASARPVRLYFGEDGGGFTAIHTQEYNFTTTMSNYEANFTVGQTFGAMKLGFEGGLSNTSFYIDNVTLELVPSGPATLDLLLGFETTESGGINGDPFGAGPAPIVETGSGTNTTQVLKIVGNPSGEPWQGINLNLTSLVNLTDTKTMTMDVFSDAPITFLVKVTGGVGGPAQVAASASHPGGSTWQTISFTFDTSLDGQAAPANGTYAGFVIHTYWAPGAVGFFNPTIPTPERTFYVDNIRGPLGTPPVVLAPTTAAPTPPNRPAADVKAIFTDVAYANVGVLGYSGSDDNTFNTSWCPAVTSLVQVEGNNTNRVTGLGCEGVAFLAGRFDATQFTHFHMDIWTSSATQDKSFNFKFSNWSGTTGETNAFEYSATNANILPSVNPGTWISIDLPFTSFNAINGTNKTDFAQFVITSDLGTVYYDNLYLHKNTLATSSFEASNIKMYPNPASTRFIIDAKTAVEKVSVYNLLGQEVIAKNPNSQLVTLDISDLQVGVYVVKATINGIVSTSRIIKE